MLGKGNKSCHSGDIRDASDAISPKSGVGMIQSTCKFSMVQGQGSFIVDPEDEVIDVEHLLAEPHNEKCFDGFYLDSGNFDKCLAVQRFPCSNEYCQTNTDCGGVVDSSVSQDVKHESNEFLDRMLQGIHDESNLHITSDFSSDCIDYLLGIGHVEKDSQLNYGSQSVLGNMGSECHSPGFNERESGAEEVSDLSNAIIQLPESTSTQSALFLDNLSIRELHDAFKSIFGRETSVKDKQWLKRRILSGFKNFTQLGDSFSLLESGFSSNESNLNMISSSCNHLFERAYFPSTNISDKSPELVSRDGGKEGHSGSDILESAICDVKKIGIDLLKARNTENTPIPQKRLRKPTRRYIEESSDVKSKTCDGRLDTSRVGSRDKVFHVRVHNQHQWNGFSMAQLVFPEGSVGVSGEQEPFCVRPQRGRPRKNSAFYTGHDSKDAKEHRVRSVIPKRIYCSDSESEDTSDDSSSTKRRKGSIRRKHHRLWNISEVMNLIEGVSRYGVGRWTEIKRLLFSTSHRTSVDLKDKWRNLLRASGAYMTSKKKVKREQKHMNLPLPPAAVCRIRELAIIHPYPRERKSKLPLRVTGTPPSATRHDTIISRSRRIASKQGS
ncbi:Telomere repeat-binding protein 4 [Acorus calamus]|uniref:Telomere repeat-binding protein 4 n=1 Tax=Acorus calamus TaxID=4465 RepID=A0AAV9E6D6_ACOCL|nr:Telomere repeat-binding protein 4 [Acorus calamus]